MMQSTNEQLPFANKNLLWLVVLSIIYWLLICQWQYHSIMQFGAEKKIFLKVVIGMLPSVLACLVIIKILTNRFWDKGKYFAFILLAISTIFICALLHPLLTKALIFEKPHNFTTYYILFIGSIIDSAIACIVYLAFWLTIRAFMASKRQHNKEKELMQYEIDALKRQMSPHFLFNVMNNIYVSMDKDPQKAKESLLEFSQLMRHQLYTSQSEVISITEELEFLGKYIELEKMRKEGNLQVSTNCQVEDESFCIPPMLLQPLVENAFKYVGTNSNAPFIKIACTNSAEHFTFSIANNIDEQVPHNNLGLGLKSVSRRLDLLYAEQHTFSAAAKPGIFEVYLQIKTVKK
jgi:sensor histidine kinase YesM